MSVVKSRVNGNIIKANEHTIEVIKLGGGKYAELTNGTTTKKVEPTPPIEPPKQPKKTSTRRGKKQSKEPPVEPPKEPTPPTEPPVNEEDEIEQL